MFIFFFVRAFDACQALPAAFSPCHASASLLQALGRLGGVVTAVDAAPENIAAAQRAQSAASQAAVTYVCGTAEDIASSGQSYQLVVSSDVLEHVDNQSAFVATCCSLVQVCWPVRACAVVPPCTAVLHPMA